MEGGSQEDSRVDEAKVSDQNDTVVSLPTTLSVPVDRTNALTRSATSISSNLPLSDEPDATRGDLAPQFPIDQGVTAPSDFPWSHLPGHFQGQMQNLPLRPAGPSTSVLTMPDPTAWPAPLVPVPASTPMALQAPNEDGSLASIFPREIGFREDSDNLSSLSCPTGGPGGLVCCHECHERYSMFMEQTCQELESQRLRNVAMEVKDLVEISGNARNRLSDSVERLVRRIAVEHMNST